ncbi:FMN-binding negative transcriptional regulator [Sphingobium lactosutens]|uniref:FMN-binding negative transcriptional regulator n=1 Tax=Sphingobium lactosutens TaxID=522773 RepID=UPI0015BE79B4|nr:FMN-binding negative transcriptional regulator [Sphingobium lactosutens]NWK94470.1 FMN-binding negative transcriptional regulator [Sphingobium lactosutens]
MKYAPCAQADIISLVRQNPLCWLVSFGPDGFGATPLPLLPECDENGSLVSLFGHCALSNPQVAQLRESPQALVLVNGPQGYISPELLSSPTWVPTWNYAMAIVQVDVAFVAEETREAIERLTDVMEEGRAAPWKVSDAEARLPAMLPHIIAFRAHVRAIDGRFKLGRDESRTGINEIVGGMAPGALRDWMRLYNDDRLEQAEEGDRA